MRLFVVDDKHALKSSTRSILPQQFIGSVLMWQPYAILHPRNNSPGNTLRSENSGKRMDVADCGEVLRELWALGPDCLNSRVIAREIPHGPRSKLTFITSSLADVRRVRACSQRRRGYMSSLTDTLLESSKQLSVWITSTRLT